MKKIFLTISIVAFAAIFKSCSFKEESIFEGSAAERLAANEAEALAHLRSAPNGWEMHYFPTNNRTGYVLLVRFDDNEMATMMGRNPTTNDRDAVGTGTYRVRTIQSTVLSFDSRNMIIHAFSDPSTSPPGQGLQGDFEFVIVSHSPDVVHLRGVKRNTHIEMRRMPENQDWSEYFDQIDELRSYLFSTNPALVLNVGNERFSLTNGRNDIFSLLPFGGGVARQIPFVVTGVGVTFAQNFVAGNNAVRRFVLNDERTQLVAMDVNFDSKIQVAPAADVFVDNVNNGNRYMVIRRNNENMSAEVDAIFTAIEDRLRAYSFTLGFIGFANNRSLRASLVLQARLGIDAPEGFVGLHVSKVGDSDEVSFAFTGDMDDNGRFFYENCDLSQFAAMLKADTYRVSFQPGGGFAPTAFHLIGNNNPNIWFELSGR